MARRLPLPQVLLALLGFHLQPSKSGWFATWCCRPRRPAVIARQHRSRCRAPAAHVLLRRLKAGAQLTNKSLLKHLKVAAEQLKDRNPGAAGTVPAPCPRTLPAPAEMARPRSSGATEHRNPWRIVQEAFPSKLFILIPLRERGADSYNVLVRVQSPV